mmetsp:Transcript_2039/g.4526  ORF Transcript_2039/g.4526 Transcript_2039/m.4526 type:complete len:344 (-) Transcript_2039:668-1699(-)
MQVLQLRDVLRDVAHHLLHEGKLLVCLHGHESPLALLADLQEGVHRHVLDAREGLVHELEELKHQGLEELPVGSQEAGVLANDVHHVAGDDGLVLLAALHLAEAQQVFDHGHKEPLLLPLLHCPADRADRPAETVQQRWRPMLRRALCQALLRQALQHDTLHVVRVKVGEINQGLSHRLVESDLVRVFLLRTDDVALLVLLNGDLGGLGHLRDEDAAHLCEDGGVQCELRMLVGHLGFAPHRHVAWATPEAPVEHQRRGRAVVRQLPALLNLEEDPRTERLPELDADLKGLLVGPHGDADEVVQGGDHVPLLRLHSRHVVLEEGGQQQGDLVVEDLPEDSLWP